jgi:hypothetical protein
MADHDGLARVKRGNQSGDVTGQFLDAIGFDRMRPVAAAVTAHVRCCDPETGIYQHRNLVPPGVPVLRKAMDQHDQGPLARDRDAKPCSAGVDSLQVDLHARGSR